MGNVTKRVVLLSQCHSLFYFFQGGTIVTIIGGGFKTRTDEDNNVLLDGVLNDGMLDNND